MSFANLIAQPCGPTTITAVPSSGVICNGQSLTLTANNNNATGFTWNPASSLSASTGTTVTASPTVSTTYTINAGGCGPSSNTTYAITVLSTPSAGFNFSPNSTPCSSTPINFTNTSTGGTGLTYSWNFDDAPSGVQNTSTQQNPSHLFSAFGTGNSNYNVTLIITSANGCTASTSHTVSVQNSPSAVLIDPSGNDFSNCDGSNGFTVTVNNGSTTQASNTNYVINWGDASPNYVGSTLPDGTSHTYSGFGYNTLTLTVTGSNGCVSTQTYNVYNGSNPSVGLANPGGTVGLCAPSTLVIPINNTSANPPGTTYTISYNDGSPNEVYIHPPPANITHTFTTSSCGVTSLGGFTNSFHVRIVASNPCGTSAATIEPIRVGLPPIVNFSGPAVSCINQTASFNSTSTANFVNAAGNCVTTANHFWSISPVTGWTVASGSQGTISTNTPGTSSIGFNFNTAGTYTVKLIVKNQCGVDSMTQNICITIPPTPNFTINTPGCAPAVINTTNTSVATACSPLTYLWNISPSTGWTYASGTSTSTSPSFNFNTAGTYTITLNVTNVCGTFPISQTITIKTPPTATIGTLSNSCGSVTISPTATIGNGGGTISNIAWTFAGGTPASSNSATPGPVTFNTPGAHAITLSVTNECGTTTVNGSVTVYPVPTISTIPSNTICSGQTLTLTSSPLGGTPNYSFVWSPSSGLSNPNSQSPIATPTTTQTYTVNLTDLNGCTATTSVTITVNPSPSLVINGNQNICIGQSTTLTASGGTTYTWSPSASLNTSTGATVTASPTVTSTYTVTANSGAGCPATGTYIVTVNPLPIVNAGPDVAVCNQPISYTLTGYTPVGGTWSGSSNVTPSGVFTPSATGTFNLTYTYTNPSTGCTNADAIIVTVINPTAANAGTGFSICNNAAPVNLIALNPTPTGGSWSGSGISGATFNPASLTAGNYTLTYSVGSGTCLTVDTIIVHVLPVPTVTAASINICAGNSGTLTATGASTYTWAPSLGLNQTTGNTVTASPLITTTYTAIGTNNSGCTSSTTSVVTVNPLPIVNAGPDVAVCNQPIPYTLTGYTPVGGTWSGSSNVTPSGVFTPSATGTFNLTYTYTNPSTGCTNADAIIVTVINPTAANAGTGFSICNQAAPVNLNTLNPTPLGGSWSGSGVTSNTFTPSSVTAGNYILTYTVGTGTCQTSDTIHVTVNPNPTLQVTPASYCVGGSGIITVTGADTYMWSPALGLSATTGSSVTSTVQANTNFTITATNIYNCTTTTVTQVVVHPLPNLSFNQNPVSLCLNSSTNITASGASQYLWSPASGLNTTTGATVNVSATVNTTYSVTGTTGFGCTATSLLPVSVNPPTSVSATDGAICIGGSTILTASNAVTYSWTPANGLSSQTGATVNASPTISTTYTVVGSTSSGCTTAATIPITVNPLPTVSIAPTSLVQCAGTPITLTANGAVTYTWVPNTALSSTTGSNVTANPSSPTTYTVTGTNAFGCTGSATSTIAIYPLPSIDAGNDLTVCNTSIDIILSGFTPQGGIWSGTGMINGTGAIFSPSLAGLGTHTVYYSIINANGCTNVDSIHITVTPVIYPNAGSGDTVCYFDPIFNLTGNSPTGGVWLGFGITNQTTGQFNPTLAGPGLHPVIYNIGQGQCTTGDTTYVLVRSAPNLSSSPNPANICIGSNTVLNVNGAQTYSWSPSNTLSSSTGSTVTAFPTVNTTYTILGTDSYGCNNTLSVPVIVHQLPSVNAGANQTLCAFDPPSYIFNFSPYGGVWSGTGITNGFTGEFSPQVSGTGTFTIIYTVTDIYNCTNLDSMTIHVLSPVAANAGLDQTVCVNAPAFNLSGFSPVGGTWSGMGITNPATGAFNPALAGVGVHKLIYSPPASQCIYKDSIFITVNDVPMINVIASSNALCAGQMANLTAGGGNSYIWSPSASLSASTGANVIATPTITTTYTVTAIDANSCSSSSTIVITMNPLPSITITPSSAAMCIGQTINLTASGAASYTWSPSLNLDQTTGAVVTTSTTATTTYTVTGTAASGCVSTQQVVVTVNPLPHVILTQQDPWICSGSNTQLMASGASTYIWSPFSSLNSSQGSTVTASPTINTTYTVTGTDANGCQDTETISLIVHPPPITFNVQPQICQWETVNIIANGASTYTWTPAFGLNTTIGASVMASPTVSSTYTVIGTDVFGCTASNSVIVTVHVPSITVAPPSAEICYGQSQTFIASGAVQYFWSPSQNLSNSNSATVVASPTTSLTYTLIGTDVYGCADTLNIPITVHPQPEADFTYSPPAGCDSLLVTFTNLSSDANVFLWTFSDGTISPLLNPTHWFSGPGNYSVTLYVEGEGGCNDTKIITDAITVWPQPIADFAWVQSNYPVLNGEIHFDNNSLNSNKYNWDFGDSIISSAINPIHQYAQYGTYFVTLIASNDYNCIDTIVKPIQVKFFKGLYLPNAMTPDYGDPATRIFTPKGFNIKSYRIQIFDTWGNLLWESSKLTDKGEPAESWDGYYKGKLLQQDVYVWKVEAVFLDDTVWEGQHYPSGEVKPTGTVTILR